MDFVSLTAVSPYAVAVSAHGPTVVFWDCDHDERVIELLDAMQPHEREELLAIGEAKGMVNLHWRAIVPRRFQVALFEVAGDVWTPVHHVGERVLDGFGGTLDLASKRVEERPFSCVVFLAL